jgi:hypothetical protein
VKFAAALALLLGVAAPLLAQDTRAEQLRRERAEKAAKLRPLERNRIEAVLFEIEDRRWMERLFNPPRGVFVRWGGLPEGAGVGAGPAARFSTHTVSVTGTSVITARKYWEIDGRIAFPRLADRHLFVEAGGRRRDFPQEDFYGLGPDSAESARTSYALRETSVDAVAGVLAGSWLTIAASVEHISPRIGAGGDRRVPSIDSLFGSDAAPGLDVQPDFVRSGALVRVDYIDAPFGSGLGGRYTASFGRFADQATGRYSFRRWDLDLQQFVPIVNNARSLALRAHIAELAPDAGGVVPFYLQPTLGGGYSLRGLPAYRLRDRSFVLFQAEYRWLANPFIAGAIFYDAGAVAPRLREVAFDDLTSDYGIGLRLGWMGTASLRTDLAFGPDGPRLVFKFSNVF